MRTYDRLVQEKKVNDDPSQRRALQHLQALHDQLVAEQKARHHLHHQQPASAASLHVPHHPPRQEPEPERAPWWKLASWFGSVDSEAAAATSPSSDSNAVKGVYMYGDVGCGKTFLMDMFYEGAPVPKKRRVHFNAFMLEVHSKIHKWREGKRRALEKKFEEDREGPDLPNFNLGVSASLGEEEWGDPIPPLARELAAQAPLLCFDEFQVTDVADAMILHRLFSLMFTHGLTVVVTSNRPPDDLYKGGLQRDRFLPFIDLIKRRCLVHDFGSGRDYRLRGNQNINIYQVEKPGVDVANNLETLFGELTHHVPAKSINISVGGRKLFVPRAERGVAFFSFSDLCKQALGAADYIAISQEFHTVIVSGIPKMEDRHREEAKRFITLIDELYNHKVKMICSAAAEPRQLFAGGVEKREWFDESTGKSVGTIWQGEEERFMFNRTVSRLIEMQSDDYLQSPHKKEV